MSREYLELFDAAKLNYIITHRQELENAIIASSTSAAEDIDGVFALCNKILKSSNNGVLKVKHEQRHGRGRAFPVAGISCGVLKRAVRHTICGDIYTDIDVQNCHPVILRHLCSLHSIECDELDNYIENRDECLRAAHPDRETAKAAYLKIINGEASVISNLGLGCEPSRDLKRFHKEMQTIRAGLLKTYTNDYSTHLKRKTAEAKAEFKKTGNGSGKPYNPEGSFINVLMCDFEHKILQCMLEFFDFNQNAVLCFDGFMIPTKCGPFDLEGCEKHVAAKLNINIKLAIKPMNEGLNLAGVEIAPYKALTPESCVPFDPSSSFLYGDFIRMIQTRVFQESETPELLYYIKSIFAYITKGKGMYIKKNDMGGGFYDVGWDPLGLKVQFEKLDGKIYTTTLSSVIDANKYLISYSELSNLPLDVPDPGKFVVWREKIMPSVSVDYSLIQPLLDYIAADICSNRDTIDYKKYIDGSPEPGGADDFVWYMLSYVAWMLRNPRKQIGLYLHLVSEAHGSGKTSFFKLLSRFYDESVIREVPGFDSILGNFNKILMSAKLILLNECISGERSSGFASKFDKFKSYVSDGKILITPKGHEGFMIDTAVNFVSISNHLDSLYLEKNDRRAIVVNPKNTHTKTDTEYWTRFYKTMENDGAIASLYSFLMKIKLHPLMDTDRPTAYTTDIKRDIQELSMNSYDKFITDLKENIQFLQQSDETKTPEDQTPPLFVSAIKNNIINGFIKSSDIYQIYSAYCETLHIHTSSATKFGFIMKQHFTAKRSNGIVYKLY